MAGESETTGSSLLSADRLSLAIEASSDGIWDWDLRADVVYWSPRCFEMLGYAPDAFTVTPEKLAELVHPDDNDALRAVMQDLVTGHASRCKIEFRCRRADGGWSWILGRGQTVEADPDGTPTRAVGTHVDISAQKEAERAVREHETFERTLLDNIDIGVVVIDPETHRIERANPAACRIFGVDAQHVCGASCFDHFCEAASGNCPVTDLGQEVNALEREVLRADGTRVPVLKSVKQVQFAGRTRLLEWFTDITDQKTVEQTLQSALDVQEAIFDTSLVGIMVLHDRVITKVNRRMAEMLGYTPEEITGRGPQDLHLSPENFIEFGEKYYWRLADQELVQIEYPLRHKDGRVVWCQFNGRAIAPPDLSKGAVWIIDDITRRRQTALALRDSKIELEATNAQLEDAIDRANEMAVRAESASATKSEFLANMSHEIRTPMTAILGYIDLIAEGCPQRCEFGTHEVQECVATVRRNGGLLLQLINDVLDISKIEAGRLQIEAIPCRTAEVLRNVESLMAARAKEKGLSLTIGCDGPVPETFISDPTRVQQVLVNLVGNAIKFTERGRVEVRASLAGADTDAPKLRIEVRDTGIGMSDTHRARLFKPFSQADASTTRKFGGTGLGLAISRSLTNLLGGDITATSTAGQGSTFTITFATGDLAGVELVDGNAILDADESAATGPAQPANTEPLRNGRVLLVEDGPDNQRLIATLLRKAGATVEIAENGQQGSELALAADPPFDVVLMDMQMPVMDGYSAARHLRQSGYNGPIIALTAHAMAQDRQRCLDAGCDDYLQKPLNRRAMLETIARLIADGSGFTGLADEDDDLLADGVPEL